MNVLTTLAPEQDIAALDRVHSALAARHLLPAEHLVDTGYVTPQAIHHAATAHRVTMIGPVREDPRARASRLQQGCLHYRLAGSDRHLSAGSPQPIGLV